MSKKVFAVIAMLFSGLLVLGIQVGPAIAIIALMGAYLLFGIGESLWRVTRSKDGTPPLDDGEDVFHEPMEEFDEYEEELID